MRRRRIAIVFVSVLLASCGSKSPQPVSPGPAVRKPEPITTDKDPGPAPLPLPAGFPDSAAGHQLAWVMDVITQHKGAVEIADIEAHFDQTFLAQVPAQQAAAVFGQLGGELGAMTIATVTPKSDTALVAIAEVQAGKLPGGKLQIILEVNPANGKIGGLLFAPASDDSAKPKTFAEAETLLPTLAQHASLLIAALDDKGACKPVHQIKSKDELAIGSTFKLYVLLALVDQIIAGTLTWDTEIAVRDEWKSLPSGVTQDDPAGTKLTVRKLAERMISISDNTATDHLLYTVGRKKVEAALASAKHAKAKLDIPFLGTRELFLLKLAVAHDEVDSYVQLSAEKRRKYLDGTLATMKPTLEGAEAWTDARRIDSLEWFASGDDLCRVMSTLKKRAADKAAAPVLDVMSMSSAVEVDGKKFPYIGFKGGSEPGVLNLTWLLRRDDDKWFVVTLGFNSTDGTPPDEAKVLGFAKGVVELVGAEK